MPYVITDRNRAVEKQVRCYSKSPCLMCDYTLTNTREPHQLESYDRARAIYVLFSTVYTTTLFWSPLGWLTLVQLTKTLVNWDSLNVVSFIV